MKEYDTLVKNGMIVKYSSKLRVTVKSGNRVLQDDLCEAEHVGGALTVISFTYNRLSYSGGVHWWHPITGESIARPKVSIRARKQDIVT
jgi:hypothetical protein